MLKNHPLIPVLLLLASFIAFPGPVAGADLSLTSLTSATSWEDEEMKNSAASQYLKFDSRGSLGGFHLDLEGYGRFTRIEEEIDPEDEDASRLYVLAATLKSGSGQNVITVGRQYVPALAGPEMIDGLSVSAEAGKAAFNARWGYRSDVTGGPGDDKVLGLGFDYLINTEMHFSIDYGKTFDDSTLTELLATEWMYSWYRFTKAYISFNWDLMSETLHESLVGARLFFSDRFTAVMELGHNVQTFDSDSIYSVFAVEAAYTRSISLLFTPSRNTRYAWDYVVEKYQDGGGGRRYVVSGHWTPGKTRINSSLLQHSGYGGDLVEFSGSVSTDIVEGFNAGVGGDLSRSENPGEPAVNSFLVYMTSRFSFGEATSLDLRLEQCDDELTEPERTGRVSLKMEL